MAPDYSDGQALLGFVLAEGRKEREAIVTYNRALRSEDLADAAALLDAYAEGKASGPGATDDPKSVRRVAELRFLRASSRMRCFRAADHVVEAIDDLQRLAGALSVMIGGGAAPAGKGGIALHALHPGEASGVDDDDPRSWAPFLLSRVYAEEAYSFAYLMIVLLNKDLPLEDGSLRMLRAMELPGGKALPVPDGETFERRRALAGAFYDATMALLTTSDEAMPTDDTQKKTEMRARRKEIEGYATYRLAEWQVFGDDTAFPEDCETARELLLDGEKLKPPSYSLLLNLGMVERSCRWERGDPAESHLGRALFYYDRSVKLKPGDYYGHEEMARVHLRRALSSLSRTLQESELADGEASLKRSIELRSEGLTGPFLGLYMALVRASLDARPRTPPRRRSSASSTTSIAPTGRGTTPRTRGCASWPAGSGRWGGRRRRSGSGTSTRCGATSRGSSTASRPPAPGGWAR